MELRWTTREDAALVAAAGHLFDSPPQQSEIEQFLAAAGHHLCIAVVDETPVGFVTGIETTHPDKGTEMLLYELAVDEDRRRRGIGRALVVALRERAAELGCYGMWVLTDDDNDAALRTYASAGATGRSEHVMFEWVAE